MLSILLHRSDRGDHLDVLLPLGKQCRCWSLSPGLRQLHAAPGTVTLRWTQNVDHRRFYLNYTGPVSGHRGRVTPIWQGPVRMYRERGAITELMTPLFLLRLHTNGLATFRWPYTLGQCQKKTRLIAQMTQLRRGS